MNQIKMTKNFKIRRTKIFKILNEMVYVKLHHIFQLEILKMMKMNQSKIHINLIINLEFQAFTLVKVEY
jgi:hypothetical protein